MTSEKKVLHILDSSIISESTFSLFEKLDYSQRYIVVSGTTSPWKSATQHTENLQVIHGNDKELIEKMVQEISSADIIYLQAFSVLKAKAINAVNDKSKVYIWGLWGYALYNMAQYFKNDEKSFSTQLTERKTFLQKLKDFYTFRFVYTKAVKKLDICLFLLKSDFDLLSELIDHKAVWRTACYQTLENIVSDPNFTVHGNSILLGNSSTPSNRHALIFDLLKKVKHSNRKVITPLNYGDTIYQRAILELGEKTLGNSFDPIIEFLPLNAYNARIQSCSHVIMAHERQQAFGTIVTMLYGGAKLYLSTTSPFFTWFRELGVRIYSVENDLLHEINSELDEETKASNRQIIAKLLTESEILQKLKSVMEDAIQLSKQKES